MKKLLTVILAIAGCVFFSGALIAAEPVKETKTVTGVVEKDKDGKMSLKEFHERRTIWFKGMDTNADGKVSKEEYAKGQFPELDQNKDGIVEKEEYVMFFVKRKHADGKAQPTDKEKEKYARRFSYRDTDKNGNITKDEYEAVRIKAFKSMDTNGDGYIVVEEMMEPLKKTKQENKK